MGKRAFVVGLAILIASLLIGGAWAASRSPVPTPSGKGKPAVTSAEAEGVHGGPKARFHDASACNLTNVSKLPGNWTHGDYLSAVARTGDQAKTVQAAHSRCGKPMKARGPQNAKSPSNAKNR